MSEPRLTAAMRVSALIRLAEAEGGVGTVIAKGDATSGPIIITVLEKGRFSGLYERLLNASGRYEWRPSGPQVIDNESEINVYLRRRRDQDPDLWLIELNVSELSRFVALATASA